MNQRSSTIKDLVVLAADLDMSFTLEGLFSRPRDFQIPNLSFEIYVHPQHDPACLRKSHEFLRPFSNAFRHAITMLDLHGSGGEGRSREQLESSVELQLSRNGWGDRATAIVIAPELENWIWSDSPEVDAKLGWSDRQPNLRQWLVRQEFLSSGDRKPPDPKSAVIAALRQVRKPRSSALFRQLASSVELSGCSDPAFIKLVHKLRSWFGETAADP